MRPLNLILLLLPLASSTLIPHWERLMIGYQQAAAQNAINAAKHPGPTYTPDSDSDLSSGSSIIPNKYTTAISRESHEQALQVWSRETRAGKSLKEIMTPTLDLIAGMVGYVAEHRWRELGLVVPVVHYWVILSGFEASHVVSGSLASQILKSTTPLPKSSLSSFISTYGGASFVRLATTMGNSWLVAALQITSVGKILHDGGVPDAEVAEWADRVWDLLYAKNSPKSRNLGVFWEKCVRYWSELPNGHEHKEL
ncbi:hypothetical protein BJ508DRAFT_411290 [Ascobolus immersus RN42]|uniref:Uncharacterized protein n=1 Tax=Ascobolus immersus RN42 TaxID=1160509 RepID=A0A3N4IL90_ASCIM|nr:hypothetical protein BJ508DRAFT_411290 [Ascobolus immersus RN42]